VAKLKVVVTDYIEPDLNWETEEMAKRGIEFVHHQLKFAPNEKVIEATRDADIVVVNMVPVTPEIIAGWEKCKLVIRHGVGYDNVDVAALNKAGLPLCYIPDYCVEEVSEQAIGLILACGRKSPPLVASGISTR
jgi:D-3-phosphoglycerate dehydrogenase